MGNKPLINYNIMIIVDVFITPITNYILNHIVGIIKEGGDVKIVAAEINKESDMHEIEKYRLFDKVLCHDTSS